MRLGVAAAMPLSPDESYYWVWSKALAPGYLDHPPMVALWIRLGTLVAGDTALGVRLLGVAGALAGTLLLIRTAEDLWPGEGAGLRAACLLNATLALNVGAVVMTPDTPLLFFWTMALAALARLLRSGNAWWWLVFGCAAGCALDSKYTAGLLGVGVLAWMAAVPAARRWFGCWQFWAAGGLAVACFAPVVAWNAGHAWASFAKQGGRTGDWQPAQSFRFLAELAAGQIGLATPVVAWLFAAGMVASGRGFLRRETVAALLACVTVLPAAVFVEHALGGRVQANWPAVIFPGAALAAAMPARRLWRTASAVGIAMVAAVFLQAEAAPFDLPRGFDPTLARMAGWADLAGEVYVAASRAQAGFVVADEYGLASELAYRLHGEVDSTEARWRDVRLKRLSLGGRTGLLVMSDRVHEAPAARLWPGAVLVGRAARVRHGEVAETYRLFRVTGASGLEGTRLPGRQEVSGKLVVD